MVTDLVRFNREMRELLASGEDGPSLGDHLDAGGYSRWFVERLIVPQASAVWSADPAQMWSFPVRFLAEFFSNHGMLGFSDRPPVDDRRGRVGALRRGAGGAVRRPRCASPRR